MLFNLEALQCTFSKQTNFCEKLAMLNMKFKVKIDNGGMLFLFQPLRCTLKTNAFQYRATALQFYDKGIFWQRFPVEFKNSTESDVSQVLSLLQGSQNGGDFQT